MPVYYFRNMNGEKIEATSQAEINRLAKREANKWGTDVRIYSGPGRASHRMTENPDVLLDFQRAAKTVTDFAERMKRQGAAEARQAMSGRVAKAASEPTRERRTGKQKVSPNREGYAANLSGKKRSANPYPHNSLQFRMWENGWERGERVGDNPAPKTPAAKARKKAAHKRGAYLCYKVGGREQRIKYANKGLASIAAKQYKQAGYAGVRVIGA